jgi:hypothetical protein
MGERSKMVRHPKPRCSLKTPDYCPGKWERTWDGRPDSTSNNFVRQKTWQDKSAVLMILRIPDINKRQCSVLWDTGAQISLITNPYAKEAGFKGCLH